MSYQFEDLKGKVAIVTGSGRGIGRAIAQTLADHGVNIVVSDVDEENTKATAQEIEKQGVETLGIVCDVTKRDQVDDMIKQATDKWGRLDILVNNAGITMDTLFMRMKEEQWQKVLDINLTGAFQCTQAALKTMSKVKSGTIVSLSSLSRYGNVGQANYSASKAGIVGFMNAVAREYAPRGIRVNCVAPGFIDTPMTQAMPDKARQQVLDSIPMGRPGQPEDIANAVLFLVSDLSGFITGQVLDVNGGLSGL